MYTSKEGKSERGKVRNIFSNKFIQNGKIKYIKRFYIYHYNLQIKIIYTLYGKLPSNKNFIINI